MELADVIGPDQVITGLRAGSKKQLFQEIANRARDLCGLDARDVLEGLLERERLGSTAMGDGIAIPHARLEKADRICGFFARLEQPIDFEAADGRAVDLVFSLLVPEDSVTEHLRALAKVSRLLRNGDICAKLRAGGDKAALYALLTEPSRSQAA